MRKSTSTSDWSVNSSRGNTPTVQTQKKIDGVRGHKIPAAKVLVVGGGLAGLCAVFEAAQAGAIVVLLEKEKNVGGNSAKATSGINGVQTAEQEALGIIDSFELFREDTWRSGGGRSEAKLIDSLVAYAQEPVAWLTRVFGLDLSALSHCGGHSAKRTHRVPSTPEGRPVPVGWTTVTTIRKRLEDMDNVTILSGALVNRLMTEDFAHEVSVTGVEYLHDGVLKRMHADAVVLCTGGYAFARGEDSLLKEFASSKLSLPTTSGPQAGGEGVKLAREYVGAHLVDMDQIQVHPTGFVSPEDPTNLSKMLAPEAMRGCGGILLNHKGERFCNELGTRAYVTEKIQQNCEPGCGTATCPVAYLVMNEKVVDDFGGPVMGFYKMKKVVKEVNGTTGLAKLIGCSEEAVEQSLRCYQQAAETGSGEAEDSLFGKTVYPVTEWGFTSTFSVAAVTPCIHYTMGGLAISTSAEVLRVRDTGVFASVLGLFAAGEVTGGLHGANRLAGNSLMECVVFGRLAGQRAAQITQDVLPALDCEFYTPVRLRHKSCVSEAGHLFEFSFELPSSRHTAFPWMQTGQYVAIRCTIDGEETERFYSPITRDNYYGKIDLLIKADPVTGGRMQSFLANLQPGTYLDMRGPMGGFDFDFAGGDPQKIGMIAGGTGISAMVQIIRQCLHEDAPTKLKLMWGVEFEEDLMYRSVMDAQASSHDNLSLTYVVNKPSEQWRGETGYISRELLEKHMFPPGPGVAIVVCGPWQMCQLMKGTLKDMGYQVIHSYM